MSKHKKAKCISLVACLCLLFGVGAVSVSYARYSSSDSANGEASIAKFDVSAALYSDKECTSEVTSLTPISTVDIASYKETYYMKIENKGDTPLSYSMSVSESFLINGEEEYSGAIDKESEKLEKVIISANTSKTYGIGETLDIKLGVDFYQISEAPERESVAWPTLNFSIKEEEGGDNVTIPEYADIYVIGSWDGEDWKNFYKLTYDETNCTYYTNEIPSLSYGYYEYLLIMTYKDEVPTGISHKVTSDNQSFYVLSDNEDWYQYNLTVIADSSLDNIITDPAFTKTNVMVTFTITYNYTETASPLEYGTLYIISEYDGWNEWHACEIIDNSYVLTIDSIIAGTYAFDAAIYYSDADIPNNIWNYKVNYGEGDASLTISDEIETSGGAVSCEFGAGSDLASILPYASVLQNYTLSFSFVDNYDSPANYYPCPEYGKLYFIAEWDEEADGTWDDFHELTTSDNGTTYTYTVNASVLASTDYWYDIVFVYNDEDMESSDFSYWDHMICDGWLMNSGDTNSFSEKVECANSLTNYFPDHESAVNGYTVHFYVQKESNGTEYVQQTNQGVNVYASGTFPGGGISWNNFIHCEYDTSLSGDGYSIVYSYTFDYINPGTYQTTLILAADNPYWGDSGWNTVAENVAFTVESGTTSQVVTVESNLWFDAQYSTYF